MRMQLQESRDSRAKLVQKRRLQAKDPSTVLVSSLLASLDSPLTGGPVMTELVEYLNFERSSLPWLPSDMASICNKCSCLATNARLASTFLSVVSAVFHPHAGFYTETELVEMLAMSVPVLDVLWQLLASNDVDNEGQYFSTTAALILRDIASCNAAAADLLARFHRSFTEHVFALVDADPVFPLWAHVTFLEEMLLRLPLGDASVSTLYRFLSLAFRLGMKDRSFCTNVLRSLGNLVLLFHERDYFVAAVNETMFIPLLLQLVCSGYSAAEAEAALVLYTELISCNETWADEHDFTQTVLAVLRSPHLSVLQTTVLWMINTAIGTLLCRGALRVLACKPLAAWVMHVASQPSSDSDDRSFAYQCLRSCLYDSAYIDTDIATVARLVQHAIAEGVVEVLLASLQGSAKEKPVFPDTVLDIDVYSNRQCLLFAREAHPALLHHLYPLVL